MALLLVFSGCSNRKKAEVISLINDYEQFIQAYSEQLSKISSTNPDSLFMLVQEIRLNSLDSASFKRKIIVALIKETEFSETNLDEILMRFAKAQYQAFDLYIAIDQRSIEAQLLNLKAIQEQMKTFSQSNTESADSDVKPIRDLDSKMQSLEKLGLQYKSKIEALRSELEDDKTKVLDWSW